MLSLKFMIGHAQACIHVSRLTLLECLVYLLLFWHL